MDESTTTSTTVDQTTTSTTVEPTTTSTTETTTQQLGNSVVVPQPKAEDLQTEMMELQSADRRIERVEQQMAEARMDAMRNHRAAQVEAGAAAATEASDEEVVA